MVILDLKVDNFYAFKNFHINFTYPKKIVGSFIDEEHLTERPNFRYKKVNIIMGANASGKTTLGFVLKDIFNFIREKNINYLTKSVADNARKATFSIEMAANNYVMYRVSCSIGPIYEKGGGKEERLVDFHVASTKIGKRDSYETCEEKLDLLTNQTDDFDALEELDKIIPDLFWAFEHPSDTNLKLKLPINDSMLSEVLNKVLHSLDPSINRVERLENVKNAYVIRKENDDIVIQDGMPLDTAKLSSGTKAGVGISVILSALIQGTGRIYYCDEKCSYIHTDMEKAILGVMIEALKPDEQLFFTTHNVDILEMDLPKHSFIFLKKDMMQTDAPIQCLSASDYLKRNTDSLRKAVENDLFSIAPNTEEIYDLLKR